MFVFHTVKREQTVFQNTSLLVVLYTSEKPDHHVEASRSSADVTLSIWFMDEITNAGIICSEV